MNGEPLSPRTLRLIALGLFILLPLLALGMSAYNFLSFRERSVLIAEKEELFAQLDARLARLEGTDRTVGDTSAIYLPANARSLASAALQERLVAAAETAGGRIIETQTVDDAEPSAEEDVVLRMTLDVTNDGLRTLMHDIETGLPLMNIETMAIRLLSTEAEIENDNPMLRVDLGVRGFWRAAS